ncbi:MAG: hypothetical protein B6D79_04840 [gamma proteobacterium symbiont of Ctena orbiculata]|nr:MAG: hypothetical protein B6D79_04840 [gamma proteobacterium symbiont of Ctena orbiculata]
MSEQAYIVAASRTPVGKAPRGAFRQTRPDDLLTHVIQGVVSDCGGLKGEQIDDVIIGCAMPEAEQGLNVARIASLLAGLPDSVPGVTINRFCSSGLQSIAMAADRIRLGEADIIVAGHFEQEILPYQVQQHLPDQGNAIRIVDRLVETDEGPRPDSNPEGLARLRPVFAAKGSVTAGNSSQMSDGAGAVVVMSETKMRALNLEPLARFVGYSVAGVPAEIMGIGPKEAIPRLEKQTGVKLNEVDWIELNEAFAAQALAVMRELNMDQEKVNPLGGAIALGHPLGATGAIRTATLLHGLRRTNQRYGMVTMCIGTGMGAAGLFERC